MIKYPTREKNKNKKMKKGATRTHSFSGKLICDRQGSLLNRGCNDNKVGEDCAQAKAGRATKRDSAVSEIRVSLSVGKHAADRWAAHTTKEIVREKQPKNGGTLQPCSTFF